MGSRRYNTVVRGSATICGLPCQLYVWLSLILLGASVEPAPACDQDVDHHAVHEKQDRE